MAVTNFDAVAGAANSNGIKSKTLTYGNSVTVPSKNNSWPWTDIEFNNVMSSGEHFVTAILNIVDSPDGITSMLGYIESDNKIRCSISNMYSSEQTIPANTINVTVLFTYG